MVLQRIQLGSKSTPLIDFFDLIDDNPWNQAFLMTIFFHLLQNLFPLYILIALGFVAGKWFNVDRRTLANLCIYIFVPVVSFGFIAQLDFRPAYVSLPILMYCLQAAIAGLFLYTGRITYKDNRANLLAMCTSMGNTGYFGLPLVMLLFSGPDGTQWVGLYMFMLVGFVVFEATIGYYIAARGAFSVRDSLIMLAKFPVIYAVIAGLIANLMQVDLPDQFLTYWEYFKGAYVIAGMMIIGAALSCVKRLIFPPRFLSLAFFGKFILWPILIYGFITLDRMVLKMFTPDVYKLGLIIAIVPPAANITAFAAQMNMKPEKAAMTVLIGTILALFYIPAVLVFCDKC